DKPENMLSRIQEIADKCVKEVRMGVTFLVLSDLNQNDFHAALPPAIMASFVHNALQKAGQRRNVTLACESASLLTGRDVAQAIAIGGVDVINPYLAFVQPLKTNDKNAFQKQCETYVTSLTEELLTFMACRGISTVSAYRGCKGFYSYGLNPDLAEQLDIQSILGGIGLNEIAR